MEKYPIFHGEITIVSSLKKNIAVSQKRIYSTMPPLHPYICLSENWTTKWIQMAILMGIKEHIHWNWG
jgi:hypothetical protein